MRKVELHTLAVVCMLMAGLALPGCRKPKKRKEMSKECTGAVVGWVVKNRPIGIRRAGISTSPSGMEERLVPAIPQRLNKWALNCHKTGQWACPSTIVFSFSIDSKGKLVRAKRVTLCAAAECLTAEAAKDSLPPALVPEGTRICVYADTLKPKKKR